jgi:hypothetical protein
MLSMQPFEFGLSSRKPGILTTGFEHAHAKAWAWHPSNQGEIARGILALTNFRVNASPIRN